MVCIKSCSIAVVFIIAMVYLHYVAYKSNHAEKMIEVLDESQIHIYNKIREERKMIYIKGLVYGLILGYLSTFIVKVKGYNKICYMIAVSYVFMFFYYILIPKSDYLIVHLNTEEQKKIWLTNYRLMQRNYYIGLLFGIIVAVLLSFSYY